MRLINDDINLYSPKKEDYLNSLEFAKTLPNSDNNNLVFHCFWRVPKEFGRKQLAVLKSIIVNHIDILDTIEINLWSNVDLTENSYFKEVEKFVKFKKWDLHEEIKETVLEDCPFLFEKTNIVDDICWLESDLFRLLILHKYGGFYLDMDVLVLRSLQPLNNYEFLYQWSHGGSNGQEFSMNNAVMRLDKESDTSLEFLEILKITFPAKNSYCWGNQLFSRLERNNILALPCVWFDYGWIVKTPDFVDVGEVKFINGPFTWHWHNKWDADIEVGSKFQLLEEKHDKIFKELLLNLEI